MKKILLPDINKAKRENIFRVVENKHHYGFNWMELTWSSLFDGWIMSKCNSNTRSQNRLLLFLKSLVEVLCTYIPFIKVQPNIFNHASCKQFFFSLVVRTTASKPEHSDTRTQSTSIQVWQCLLSLVVKWVPSRVGVRKSRKTIKCAPSSQKAGSE